MPLEKKALVIGLGISGKAAAEFLLSLNYSVLGTDQKKLIPEKDETLSRLVSLGLQLVEESEINLLFKGITLVVPSPGVPSWHPLLKEAQTRGIEIIGEAELALRHMKQRAVAITGTNGKTTVTLLVEHALKIAGKKAKALGNVGNALTKYVMEADPEEIAVVELSSYQLETLHCRPFEAAVILNITPDHLDRYASMQDYALAKIKIAECIKPGGSLYVYEEVAREYGRFFSSDYSSFDEEKPPMEWLFLRGHDLVNAKAAWLLCSQLGVSQDFFIKGLETFQKPAHRIEWVRQIRGVHYYDDSKGTNIDAAIKAVSTLEGKVILIAGGVDKGSSYMPWKKAFEGKVTQMFLIGEAASKIQEELGLFFNVKIVDSLADAVQAAYQVAAPGDSVLLSPGCSSLDMFRDYTHRGKEFQRFVGLLEEGRNHHEP